MATEGTASEDVHTTCSVCLEPYRGPALLSCLHTVCLACFPSLLRLQRQRSADGTADKSREDLATTVCCPVCRKVSRVSYLVDADLQKNLCIEKTDSRQTLRAAACDLCDEGRDAVVRCTECQENICLQCRRFHDKYNEGHVVRSLPSEPDAKDNVREKAEEQVKILPAMMVRLGEEEEELCRQRHELEEDINARWSAGLLEMAKARDKCVSELKALVRAHEIQLQQEKATLAAKHAYLKSLMSSTQTSLSVGPTELLQAALLTDEVSYSVQKRIASVTPSRYVIYTKNDCTSFQSSVEEFMGFVLSPDDEVSPKNVLSLDSPLQKSESCGTDDRNLCLPLFVPDVKAIEENVQNADSRDNIGSTGATNATYGKVQLLVDKVDNLLAQLDDVKNENKVLQTQMLSLQDLCFQQNTDSRDEYRNMMQEMTQLKEANSGICHEMSLLRDKESKRQHYEEKLNGDFSRLQMEWETSRALFLALQQEVDNLSKDQARHQNVLNGVSPELTANESRLSQLETDLKQSQTGLSSLQKDVLTLKCSQNQIPALQRTNAAIQREQASLASEIQKYSTQMQNLEKVVAYHAILNKDVTLSSDQVLVADYVITNKGDAYDSKTGVFTAPVSGTYIFLATTGSNDGKARVDVIADDVRIAHTYALKNARATCHAVVELDSGQKVFLKTFECGTITFSDGWWTSFSGSLLKAKT